MGIDTAYPAHSARGFRADIAPLLAQIAHFLHVSTASVPGYPTEKQESHYPFYHKISQESQESSIFVASVGFLASSAKLERVFYRNSAKSRESPYERAAKKQAMWILGANRIIPTFDSCGFPPKPARIPQFDLIQWTCPFVNNFTNKPAFYPNHWLGIWVKLFGNWDIAGLP